MASVHNLIVKRGEAEILKNFSAEFPEHQVTAVSGRSGCGKTTLLSVLLNHVFARGKEKGYVWWG